MGWKRVPHRGGMAILAVSCRNVQNSRPSPHTGEGYLRHVFLLPSAGEIGLLRPNFVDRLFPKGNLLVAVLHARPQLQPVQRALPGQRPLHFFPPHQHPHQGILPQLLVVVQVFVAQPPARRSFAQASPPPSAPSAPPPARPENTPPGAVKDSGAGRSHVATTPLRPN